MQTGILTPNVAQLLFILFYWPPVGRVILILRRDCTFDDGLCWSSIRKTQTDNIHNILTIKIVNRAFIACNKSKSIFHQ